MTTCERGAAAGERTRTVSEMACAFCGSEVKRIRARNGEPYKYCSPACDIGSNEPTVTQIQESRANGKVFIEGAWMETLAVGLWALC